MTAGGKGHARRPEVADAYSAGYDATFRERSFPDGERKADQAWVDSQRAEYLRRVSTMYTQANKGPGLYSLQHAQDAQE